MTHPRRDLFTCPDCNGILEPARPAWTTALQVAVGPERPDLEPMPWHCPLCGYRVELSAPTAHEPPRWSG